MSIPQSIGRYRVEGELGRGGMGVVYRARDPELERPVAVKLILLPPDASRELREELEKRFRREAKAAARIRHPGVVAIHDVGTTSEGLFLVMELVEGGSLADRLERGEFPDQATAIDLAARAAEALGAAHRAGVVHRDVKPANVMLSADGRVLLTDFGVARSLDEVSELTRTGMVVGSPAYMAPEQLQGAPVDGRADLFSLGVVLYELLLRKRPFPAQSITTLLYQILHEDPLADPNILRELDPPTAEALRRLLAKQPHERFQDAGAAAAALRALPVAMERAHDAPTRVQLAAPAAIPATPTAGWSPQPPAVAEWAAPATAPPWQPGAPAQGGSPPGAWPSTPGAPAATWPPATPQPPGWAPGGTWPPPPGAPAAWGAGGPTPTPWEQPEPRRRPSLALLWAGTALAALVVTGGVVAWYRSSPERPRVEGTRPANAGWDPAAAGALPEPTGAPAPAPTPDLAFALTGPTPVPLAAPPTPPPRPLAQDDTAARPEPVYEKTAAAPAPPPERRDEPAAPTAPPARPAPVVATPDQVVSCREELEFDDVEPEEAQVWVDGRFLGTVEDLETLKFDHPGRYLVRFTYEGYHPQTVEVHVAPDARRKVHELELELPEIEEPE